MRFGPIGIWELLIILVVVLLIFGPRRLPEMAKGIGQSVREFRKGIRDIKDEIETEVSKPEASKAEVAKDDGGSAAKDETPAKSESA